MGIFLRLSTLPQFPLDPPDVRGFHFLPLLSGECHGRRYIPSHTWTYVEGEWLSGNPPLIGPTSRAMWLGSTAFNGARWFDGIAPDLDLHCQRINRSVVGREFPEGRIARKALELDMD